MRFFITGTAGFIGFHLARRLLAEGHTVAGFDALTDYYDPQLKRDRHALLAGEDRFASTIGALEDRATFDAAVATAAPDVIVHLAAQAGVRYSYENPRAFVDTNLAGTFNVIEAARRHAVGHFLLASTSSVYGAADAIPFTENQAAVTPLSTYAATKRAGELLAHSHAHLHGVATTAMRFFTVYGSWGRPDMALFRFVDAILNDKPIDVHGNGRMSRDFTYVGDLVETLTRLIDRPPRDGDRVENDTLSPAAPFRVVNVGAGSPTPLLAFIEAIERRLGRSADKRFVPIYPGEVPSTFASADLIQALTGYKPDTPLEDGIDAFVTWYLDYYGVRLD